MAAKNFFAQNFQWLSSSVEILKTKDISNLHRDISRRVSLQLSKLPIKTVLSDKDLQERKRLVQTLRVLVPAQDYSASLLNARRMGANSSTATVAASHLSVFLLGMVAQSSVFPDTKHLRCTSSTFHPVLPAGLKPVHRSVALDILRDNADVFGACPDWVRPLVVRKTHISADKAIKKEKHRCVLRQQLDLRKKIIGLGMLTTDEEQTLMRFL